MRRRDYRRGRLGERIAGKGGRVGSSEQEVEDPVKDVGRRFLPVERSLVSRFVGQDQRAMKGLTLRRT